ncbi:hypothetical protein EHQ24_06030 [Leptospira noumeaensis]|uniref:Porin n=1 Tax=Leptospira noumeaensis TaxID=2484964 RepID=A0A4R9IFD7_9LEPT|nr:hypothetical protein [Leptospira noumeaensis]TGK86133.1 hypothetical protein EHQ24_06030 [Leptospira noumeaensis]
MKKIILLILLISSSSILAQSQTENIQKKLWYFSINKAWSTVTPYEVEQYTDIFGPYKKDPKRNVNSFEIIVRKKFSDSKFGLYSEFYEFVKRDYSMNYLTFDKKVIINEEPTPIGNYYRSQAKIGLTYSILPQINFLIGSRYYKSELTDGNSTLYQIKFGQKYIGPEIAVETKSDTFYNFYLETRISYFLLYGRSTHNYSFADRYSDQGYISVNINPITRVQGTEGLLKIGYYFNQNFFMSIGYKYTYQRIRPDDLRVYSGDSRFDFKQNTEYGLRNVNSYSDRIDSIILEIGTEI